MHGRVVELYELAGGGQAVVICLDEFGPLNLQPQPGGKGWSPRAKPKRIRATYKRPHGVRHLISAYDVGRDRLTGTASRSDTNTCTSPRRCGQTTLARPEAACSWPEPAATATPPADAPHSTTATPTTTEPTTRQAAAHPRLAEKRPRLTSAIADGLDEVNILARSRRAICPLLARFSPSACPRRARAVSSPRASPGACAPGRWCSCRSP
jgi:hypothetical protein